MTEYRDNADIKTTSKCLHNMSQWQMSIYNDFLFTISTLFVIWAINYVILHFTKNLN